MKIIAAIEADFERSGLGLPSRLNDDLCGETVLRRTLKRVLAARGLAGVHLVVEADQAPAARAAIADLPVQLETHAAGTVPWRDLVASGRKWSLDSWRGGVAGSTVFDEAINPWVLEALGRRETAAGVINVPAAAALLDPALLDILIGHFEESGEDVRMTFTQSPPGLSAPIYAVPLLAELAKIVQSPGRIMAYHPNDPRKDMTMQACFCSVAPVVMHGWGRCLADTQSAVDRMTDLLETFGERDRDAPTLARRLTDRRYVLDGTLPGEVEIELTTDDPLGVSCLRPRGDVLGRRDVMDDAVFDRLIDELATRDDVRVVLGGFGDPLRHPRWASFVARCREAGIFGLALRTPAVELDEQAAQVMTEHRVDVLNVLLDADTADTYRKVHGTDAFDRVHANLDRVFAAHGQARRPLPIVVPEMLKTHDTLDEIEAFYDRWLSKTGSAVIAGPSTYGGRRPDLGLMRMAPPARGPCRRIFDRALVLADGRVTACDQDFRGEHAVGSLADASLADLWTGDKMQALRNAHLDGRYDAMPLCQACDEWHRP